MTVHKWRVGDLAMLAGEPVAIAGFIDHGEPGPLDEVLVELANGEERTVRRDELTSMFDVIQGQWQTREVYLAGGRLNPAESLAVARHSPTGFGWGYGGSGPAQLALAILLRATDRETAVAHYQAFKWEVIAKLPQTEPWTKRRFDDANIELAASRSVPGSSSTIATPARSAPGSNARSCCPGSGE